MTKYGKKARKKVKKVMREYKKGKLKTHGKRVKNRKQAVAIGISEARARGYKVPKRRKAIKRKW